MSPDTKLAFMVEFGLLLRPKQHFAAHLERLYPDWAVKFEQTKQTRSQTPTHEGMAASNNAAEAEADALRQEFRKQTAELLTTLARTPTVIINPGFSQWSVVDESALDELPGCCRLKLISRATGSDHTWQEEFDQVFAALDKFFDVVRTDRGPTRIQVLPPVALKGRESPEVHGYLNKILKAISYFAIPVNNIIPAERKSDPDTMPNMLFDCIAENFPALRQAYGLVQAEGWKPLFDIYDSRMEDSLRDGEPSHDIDNDSHRVWHFQHVINAYGIVEFRQYPEVTTSAAAKHWVGFTLGFIYAAAFQKNVDWTQISAETTHPSVGDLEAFIKTGLGGLEPESQGALKSLEVEISDTTG